MPRMFLRLPFGFDFLYPPYLEGDCPPMAGRARSSASVTRRFRPLNSRPLNFSMASTTAVSSANATKANPLGRPVIRSTGRNTSVTCPTSANRLASSLWVVSKLRFPTKTFELMMSSFQRMVSVHEPCCFLTHYSMAVLLIASIPPLVNFKRQGPEHCCRLRDLPFKKRRKNLAFRPIGV